MSTYDGLTENQALDLMVWHFRYCGGLTKYRWFEMRALAVKFGYSDTALCNGNGLVPA